MDVNGGNDTTKSNRRSSRQDHQEPARDQAALAPAPTQSSAHQPEGDNRGQGAAGSGNPGRQNRWAKNVDAGPEQWGKPGNQPDAKQGKEEKPEPEANFALSGKLAAESNTVKGVVLVHQEPPEARKPSQMWRLYGFKNGEPIDKPLYIHRQTCYLFGRERRVADVPLDHPSISKQHAVMQYRHTDKPGADGMMHSGVRPYLMDLGSANGTYLNNDRIEAERYYELLEKDMIKFGHSTREYVLLHAQSNA
ncbi:MAG: FHA domain-containing DDL-like [Trebouxia sp. A1-2]|nr:MAG: FHA domain-containing DDL-like [Trebouxia sp. A1-2]